MIWYLERIGRVHHDEMVSTVVYAADEAGAREVAAGAAGDERGAPWRDPTRSSCEAIGVAIDEHDDGLICRDFKAG